MCQIEVLQLHCAVDHQAHNSQVSVLPELSFVLFAQVSEELVNLPRMFVDFQEIVEGILRLVEFQWQLSCQKKSKRETCHAAIFALEGSRLVVLVEHVWIVKMTKCFRFLSSNFNFVDFN